MLTFLSISRRLHLTQQKIYNDLEVIVYANIKKESSIYTMTDACVISAFLQSMNKHKPFQAKIHVQLVNMVFDSLIYLMNSLHTSSFR